MNPHNVEESNDNQNSQTYQPLENIGRPIVIVPGFMGSSLSKINSKYRVWPAHMPLSIRHLSMKNKLNADGLTPGYYTCLIKFLISIGYKKDKTLFAFSYDWRQSVKTNGIKLYDFIKKIKSIHGFDSVDIINHSMGGLITREAHRIGASISRSIYLASPHYGMHTAYLMIIPSLADEYNSHLLEGIAGSPFKLKLEALYAVGTLNPGKKITEIISCFPSVYDLLPDKFYFKNQPLVNNIKKMEETYFGDNSNLGPWNFPLAQQDEVRRSMRFKERLGKDLPGYPNLIIYSDSEPTEDLMLWEINSPSPKITIKESGHKGDETIGTKSQMLNGGNPNGSRERVSGIHSEIQNKTKTHNLIYQFLNST